MTEPDVAQTELDIDHAAELAITLHRQGQLAGAEKLYRAILSIEPEHPDVTHFLGLLMHELKRPEEALRLMQASVALRPDFSSFRLNLGNVLLRNGQLDAAEEAYHAGLAIDPANPRLHGNLGVAQRGLGRTDESEASYRRAIALDPAFAEAHDNLGRLLTARGRPGEAIQSHSRALTLRPNAFRTRAHLVLAHAVLGQVEEAKAVLEQWLAAEPDNPEPQHLRAACFSSNVPERASDRYVETTFDRFAESFDSVLESLDYRAPGIMAEALRRAVGASAVLNEALDAGCGTGLSGLAIAPLVRRLTGVDLSGSMLEQARRRGIYADLIQDELTRYLERKTATYDVIVAADTLVYFGVLNRVLSAAAGALRPSGLLAFTLEAHEDGPDYRLNLHGRYSQRRAYIERSLADVGLTVLALAACTPRQEAGVPVAGWVVTARKPPVPHM
jgi:predicted TPR repeat methyltransferase